MPAMSDPLKSYLKAHRKLCGFTQAEVAYLLGLESAQAISKLESLRQMPSIETAFAAEILFDVPARDLFAGVFADVRENTEKRAYLLARKLETLTPTLQTARKLERLHLVFAAALDESKPHQP